MPLFRDRGDRPGLLGRGRHRRDDRGIGAMTGRMTGATGAMTGRTSVMTGKTSSPWAWAVQVTVS